MTTIELKDEDIKKAVDERVKLDQDIQKLHQQKQQVERAIQMTEGQIGFVSGRLDVMGIKDINEYLANKQKEGTEQKTLNKK